MEDLDQIDRRMARLRERLVSAISFSVAATGAGVVIPAERQLMLFVAMGAMGWAAIEVARLRFAAREKEETLDRLVLAGSSDRRCERRRAQLRSARVQRDLARMLRQTCRQSHCSTIGSMWMVDRRAVHAVETDLEDLAATFDKAAGHVPAEAVVRTRMLLAPPSSPLYTLHLDDASEKRAIRDAERMIARCRAELHG